ncbi:TPA: DUF6765 family protein [Vibrio cholerae]|uniref:DUF6765 family protein n=1 Tax=Vibrio cholerae TaxID=666 RepID=UPI000DE30698|nr:DUF6765 family protein [Vibrio cholerae]EGQ7641750.1 hypothetical protein [Vibrio cholerae]EGQ9892273.1 hypothetical protein [Vibrio cholerae]EJL6633037.1 hypothetical protein [Vibrio cholerae]EJL7002021.1 hypothetical protein [Vibrio cholerae]EJO4004267.1 hypothetical protein [Vibrio cholerae]
MQIDMHYYGTYCVARAAGIKRESARIIATAAQFVDDNAQQNGIDLADASACRVEATAHHASDVSNIDPDDQRQVWVPFHFLPGNEGTSFTERLVCRKDSVIAQQMCQNHLEQTSKPYFLELIGIMAHVYADTFAHYGFSGVSSRYNRVVNDSFEFSDLNEQMEAYIVGKKDSFFARFNPFFRNIKSHLAEELSGALGHGGVVTFPDRPYLKWRFEYDSGHDSGWRDNPATFLEYCQKLHGMLSELPEEYTEPEQRQDWTVLKDKIAEILAFQATGDDRIKKWKRETQYGELLNIAEDIPEYNDWNDGFESLSHGSSADAMGHPIYRYYQAASYHRWYILRELLPQHGLMVS